MQYVQEQGGLCWHCKCSLFGPPSQEIRDTPLLMQFFPGNFLEAPIHLHHDHNTGLTIGAVHSRCNAVLWQHHGQ